METSLYKSDPRFAPNIVKIGEIWGQNQNDVIIFLNYSIKSIVVNVY